MQIWDVKPNGDEKLVTRVNWTDRFYSANQLKQKFVNGQAYSHIFKQGNKIRVKLTNLDNVPLYNSSGDTADTFLRTNPFILPVLKAGVNKLYINGSSRSYLQLPLINFVIGINQITQTVPLDFKLHQNYPNPFNPVTKIRFEVPSARTDNNVKIIIYDIKGTLISLLVNGNFTPGVFEAEWNAASFSSGIYFYQMTVNNFSETRKMIVVK